LLALDLRPCLCSSVSTTSKKNSFSYSLCLCLFLSPHIVTFLCQPLVNFSWCLEPSYETSVLSALRAALFCNLVPVFIESMLASLLCLATSSVPLTYLNFLSSFSELHCPIYLHRVRFRGFFVIRSALGLVLWCS
jgi:hypothetical protein